MLGTETFAWPQSGAVFYVRTRENVPASSLSKALVLLDQAAIGYYVANTATGNAAVMRGDRVADNSVVGTRLATVKAKRDGKRLRDDNFGSTSGWHRPEA